MGVPMPMNQMTIRLIPQLLAAAVAAFTVPQADCQTEIESLRSLQTIRNDLYRKISPGIVSVEVVHQSVPALAMASLEKCASDCRLQPWRCGDLSEQEIDLWRGWGDSFLSHTELKLAQGVSSSTPETGADWRKFFEDSFGEWREASHPARESQRESFDKFTGLLSSHVAKVSSHLEHLQPGNMRPLTLKQTTGFLVDQGLVVTTLEVARRRKPYEFIRVWSDALVGFSTGEIIGQDPETNLAVIRLASPGARLLPTLRFTTGRETNIGDFVFAFWHAFGQPVSMRCGEITGSGRKLPFFPCATFLETSLPTSPGTLGAPLVNLDGELVGMGTVFMSQGTMSEITFALPSSPLIAVVNQIRQGGTVQRAKLGIFISEVSSPGGLGKRVMVKDVEPAGTAARNGIQTGDVIVALNDQQIHCKNHLIEGLARFKPRDEVHLDVERAGQTARITLDLDPMVPPPVPK
jgi:S1-C subfamily serine protease